MDLGSYKPRAGDRKVWIPKSELEEGAWYAGHCRNASKARWKDGKFHYLRSKFGCTFWEEIECPEDDRGFDVFFAEQKLDGEPASFL